MIICLANAQAQFKLLEVDFQSLIWLEESAVLFRRKGEPDLQADRRLQVRASGKL